VSAVGVKPSNPTTTSLVDISLILRYGPPAYFHSTRRSRMLPACRTDGEGFAIPTFDVALRDVEGFMEELWGFQSAFHDCFARSEPRAHCFAVG
jgi:hypothetical protein